MDTGFGELIDRIYEASVVPELWPEVLARLMAFSESWGAALLTVSPPPQQQYRYIATPAFAPVIDRAVAEGGLEGNRRPGRALARNYAGWLSDLDILTPDEHATDPVYNRYYRPIGLGFTAGCVMPLPAGDILVFDITRRTDRGPFEHPLLRRLDSLRPHLARSALISAQLGLARARSAADTLALLGLPVAVIGAGSKVLAVNSAFGSMPKGHIEIGARDRLAFIERAANALLRRALDAVHCDDATTTRSIPMPATEASPAIVAHVAPVRRSAQDLFSGTLALLILTPVAAPDAPGREVLTALFDLTPAEANVARAIGNGFTVETAAAALGVSPETVRSHLKRVLAKTGLHRQTELVRMLAGTSARSPDK